MINKFLYIFLFLFSFTAFSQKCVYKDENETFVNENEFQKKWFNKNLNLYRWDFIQKGKRFCTLKEGRMINPGLRYDDTVAILEKKIDTTFSKNAVIILDFTSYKDICTPLRDNHWFSTQLQETKDFNRKMLDEFEKKLKDNNQELYVFYVFEKGMKINKKKTNYFNSFILDSDNFFRDNYFKDQAMCGSGLIITSNNSQLYNGEGAIGFLMENFEEAQK